MVVLHFVPRLDVVNGSAFLRYKTALLEAMADSAEVHILTLGKAGATFGNPAVKTHFPPHTLQWSTRGFFAKTLALCKPDIVHIHALWETSAYRLYAECARQHIPTVITLDHQLDRWHMKQGYLHEKLPKLLLHRRQMLANAGALHFVTRQEYSAFLSFAAFCRPKGGLCLNKRCSIIEPPTISCKTTANDMSIRLLALYRKVADSFPFFCMDEKERRMEDLFLALGRPHGNAGVPVTQEDVSFAKTASGESLRRILLHSSDEGILDYVKAGIKTVSEDMPLVEVGKIDRFKPDAGTGSHRTAKQRRDMKSGKAKPDEAKDAEQELCTLITTLLQKTKGRTVRRADFAEVCTMLETHGYDEDLVSGKLRKTGLLNDAARLLQIMKERFHLSEGFMFTDPLDDRKTGKIRKKLYKSEVQ